MYPHERSLVKKLENQPFALLGVNTDSDRAALKKIIFKESITWRSWYDGSGGPIVESWGITGFPTLIVIDDRGIIRRKLVGGPFPDDLVQQLLLEVGKNQTAQR